MQAQTDYGIVTQVFKNSSTFLFVKKAYNDIHIMDNL